MFTYVHSTVYALKKCKFADNLHSQITVFAEQGNVPITAFKPIKP